MKLETILEIDTTDVLEGRKTDDRGRVALGPEYAGREVDVVVVDHRSRSPDN